MEDGGGAGRARDPKGPDPIYAAAVPRVLALIASPNVVNTSRLGAWLRGGFDLELDIIPAISNALARKRHSDPQWSPKSLDYFDGAVADAKAARERPMPQGRSQTGPRANGPPPRKLSVAERQDKLEAWGLTRAGRDQVQKRVIAEGLFEAWTFGDG